MWSQRDEEYVCRILNTGFYHYREGMYTFRFCTDSSDGKRVLTVADEKRWVKIRWQLESEPLAHLINRVSQDFADYLATDDVAWEKRREPRLDPVNVFSH